MSKTDVFHVVTVERVGEDGTHWLARGRAWEDVSVGDVVCFDVLGEHGGEQTLRFRVVAIMTYGKETPMLSRIMTGDLIRTWCGML